MADRLLKLNQQIALLPASIPDTVLDFLEDFAAGHGLQSENARAAFDPEYLKGRETALQGELAQLRADLGALQQIHVDQGGRDIPGAFLVKLSFEKGVRGLGLLTRLKERTILRIISMPGEYAEEGLKVLLKNPPPLT